MITTKCWAFAVPDEVTVSYMCFTKWPLLSFRKRTEGRFSYYTSSTTHFLHWVFLNINLYNMQSIMLAIQASMMTQYNITILHHPYTECRYCTALHQHALLHIHTKQQYSGDISRMKIDSLTNVMKRKLGLMKRSIIQNSETFRYFSN